MLNVHKKGRLFARRAFILAGIKGTLLASLLGRLYYLQIIKTNEYKTFSDSNRIKDFLLAPLRGKILDREGRVLAANRNYYRVLYDPLGATNVSDTVNKLANLLGNSADSTALVLKKIKQHSSHRSLMIYEHLSWDQVAKVEVNAPDLPGISIDVGQNRYFPMGNLSPHTIGYLGPVSEKEIRRNPLLNHPDFKIGMSGLEKSYDSHLRGEPGYKRMEVDAHGLTVSELSRTDSVSGSDLFLTLDKRLQSFASERLAGESGSVVVIDMNDGSIVTMASTPGFDPNQFTYGVSSDYWANLIEDEAHPLTNKALTHQYPPGSTFKLIVALAALKKGIDPNQKIYCPGYVVLGRRRFHCWKEHGHGKLSMVEALKHSCNVYFYTISKRIGVDAIASMARKFGLGEAHDVGTSEQKLGLVPDKQWKKRVFKQAWQVGDTLNVGIGQGDVLATPIQLAVMVARVASGKRIVPHLTIPADDTKEYVNFPDIGVDDSHLKLVREGMRRVVNEPGGTAFGSRITKRGFKMAGKTGTSQVISKKFTDEERDALTPKERKKIDNHALFVGFSPVDKPRYAAVVVVEHGGGGSKAAAPVGRDILYKIQTLRKDT